MNIKIQIIIAVIVLAALCVIVNMIRQKRLELRYALAWLMVGIGILILDCFPQLTTLLAHAMGVASPVNMLFFLGFCFALIIIFVLTVAVSRMSIKIKELAQELAVHERECREISDSREKAESTEKEEPDQSGQQKESSDRDLP